MAEKNFADNVVYQDPRRFRGTQVAIVCNLASELPVSLLRENLVQGFKPRSYQSGHVFEPTGQSNLGYVYGIKRGNNEWKFMCFAWNVTG